MNKPINIVFDGPPHHVAGKFVEVEADDGAGIHVGEWIEREDGCWSLRITELPQYKFDKVYCSQCGREFGPGDHGFSHCQDHRKS